jgi:hypothetical protein
MSGPFTGRWRGKTTPSLDDHMLISFELSLGKRERGQKVIKIGKREKEEGILSHCCKNEMAIFHTSFLYIYI